MDKLHIPGVYEVIDGCLVVDEHYPDGLLERVEKLRVISPSAKVALAQERLLLVGYIPHLHLAHQDLGKRCEDISRLAQGLENSGEYDVIVAGSRKQAQESYVSSKIHGPYDRVVITLPDNPDDFLTGAELLQTAHDIKKDNPSVHITVVVGKNTLDEYKSHLEHGRVRYNSGKPTGWFDAYYDRESLLAMLEGAPASQDDVNIFVQQARDMREQRRVQGQR